MSGAQRVSYVEPAVPRVRRGLRVQAAVVAVAVVVLGAVSAGLLAPLSAAAPAAVGVCDGDPNDTVTKCPPPVAVDDPYSTPQNTVLTVPAPGVLSNDEAPTGKNGQPVGLTVVDLNTSGTKGTVALDRSGALTYTPPAGFTGTDTFTYRAENQTYRRVERSEPATVTITVAAPVATRVRGGGTLTTGGGQQLSLSVDAQITTTGAASGKVAVSGGNAFTSRTITDVRRQGATATVTGTASGAGGATGPFTLTVTDRGSRGDQVTVTFGRTTTTGTLTNGDITLT